MLVAVQPQQARIVLVIHLHDEADHRAIVAIELGRELATNIIGPYGVLDRADIEDAGELAEMIGHDTAPHCKDRLGGGYISAHHDASRRRSRDASSSASDSRPGSESRTMIASREHTVPATRAIVAAAGCCLSSSDLLFDDSVNRPLRDGGARAQPAKPGRDAGAAPCGDGSASGSAPFVLLPSLGVLVSPLRYPRPNSDGCSGACLIPRPAGDRRGSTASRCAWQAQTMAPGRVSGGPKPKDGYRAPQRAQRRAS